ncbi:MAG: glutamine amidotransferase [Desulfuromonadales bacterium]
MKKIHIIKAGEAFAETAAQHGDFDVMIRRGLGVADEQVGVIAAYRGEPLPPPAHCSGIVITGAHCMVTDDLPWSLAIEAWIPKVLAHKVPLLGICYGHQLLGRAMGGTVADHPKGKEVGTFPINLQPASQQDPLFGALPDHFPVHTSHTQSVITLPPGAVLLAANAFEPHHAMRIGSCAWGVQFHPEYDTQVARDYILAQADSLQQSGRDVAALLADVRQTPSAAALLRKFACLACGG